MKEHSIFTQAQVNRHFLYGCRAGDLKRVVYVLSSPEIDVHANIHVKDDLGLQHACANGHTDIVAYLLSAPELAEHADIHATVLFGLTQALENKHVSTITYLLYDMRMSVTPEVYEYIGDKEDAKALLSMVEKRDLFFQINTALSHKEEAPSSKTKI